MAPHTPPPGARSVLAALTIASTPSVVMSTTRARSFTSPGSARTLSHAAEPQVEHARSAPAHLGDLTRCVAQKHERATDRAGRAVEMIARGGPQPHRCIRPPLQDQRVSLGDDVIEDLGLVAVI